MAKLVPGANDLATVNPELAAEWHPIKNGDLKPEQVAPFSDQRVWWLGKCGHEWETQVKNRSRGRGCPFCVNKAVLPGVNDLATVNPDLAAEWHPTKNGDLTPKRVTAGSNKKVWWLGKCGHEWEVRVANRNQGDGCPYCSGKKVLSGYNDFATTHPALAAEWHPTKNGDLTPHDVTYGYGKKVWWQCSEGHEWEVPPNTRTNSKSGCPYCSGRKPIIGVNDLATVNPKLAAEWHPTKNGDLKPTDVTQKTGKLIWWLGKCGHEWQAAPHDRNQKGVLLGCPICSGHQVLAGFNDLATLNPELATEWHPTKNGALTPSQFTRGSNKKVWWLGKCGHEWEAKIRDRDRGNGCPVCQKENQTSFAEQSIFFYLNQLTQAKNRYLLDGKTEIDIYLPEFKIGIEYDGYWFHHGEKAKKKELKKETALKKAGISLIRIKEVTNLKGCVDSDEVIYCKYSYDSSYLNNTIQKLLCNLHLNCDVDVARDRLKIYALYIENNKQNSVAAVNPELAAEWHPTKNSPLLPSQIQAGSGKKVWWLGKCGHEWEAIVYSRNKGFGCPICSGKVKLQGFNDLATTHPELAAEWHPTKNGDLTPELVTHHSNKKVWWLGKCGHEWQAVISNRHVGQGCPYCAGVKVLQGFNDLATTHPELAAEWHPTKNKLLKPTQVSKGSKKKVWWLGKCGHEWDEEISHRTGMNLGCPICANRRLLPGFNDLATVNPKLAAEWHPTKNGDLLPSQVVYGSGKKAWWKCSICGREWEAQIYSRHKGRGCRPCSMRKQT